MTKKLYRPAAPFVWIDPADPDTHQVLTEAVVLDEDHPAVCQKPLCFIEIAPTMETPEWDEPKPVEASSIKK